MDTTADKLFKEFKEISVTEFFRKNKAHLGYSGAIRSLTTVIHELVTNSLDACEEAGILPEVTVELHELGEEHYRFVEKDNGPGIPLKHISSVFGKMLAGTKFHRNIQLRGQQGIGVSGVTMFSQMTTGKPLKIRTSTGTEINEIEMMVDISKNKAEIISQNAAEQSPDVAGWRGTEIEGELKDVVYKQGEKSPYEYLRRTALANPHARITFTSPDGKTTVFERSVQDIPNPPVAVLPHPKGITVDDLFNMARASDFRNTSAFLKHSFSRISSAKVHEIESMVGFPLKRRPNGLKWEECEQLVRAFKKVKFLAPSMEGLRPIGETQINNAMLSILDPQFSHCQSRSPLVHSGGVPFQIEVGIAYGGSAGRKTAEGPRAELLRFANRSPLLFDAGGCAITKAVNSIKWSRYGIKKIEEEPVTIFVNVVSTYIPYTSAGKQSIAYEQEIIEEIKKALMEIGRHFERHHARKHRAMEMENKKKALMKYSKEVAGALAKLTGKDSKELLENLKILIEKRFETGALDIEDEQDPEKPEIKKAGGGNLTDYMEGEDEGKP